MPQWIVKNITGTFAPGTQPDGFKALLGIQNRFFVCECPVQPNGDFVVEFPTEQQARFVMFQYSNNKKLPFDPFNGAVEFDAEVDAKGRRKIKYSSDQLAARLQIFKWFMLNVWIPDQQRMLGTPQEVSDRYVAQVNALTTDEEAQIYLQSTLYYNL